MYPPNQPKILARPRSSLSTDEHRLKKKPPTRRNPSIAVLSLLGICVFLFVLCACVIAVLVLVGKNYSKPSSGNFTVFSLAQKYPVSSTDEVEVSDSRYSNNQVQSVKPKVVFRPNQILPSVSENISDRGSGESADQWSTISQLAAATDASHTMSKMIKKLSFRLPKEIKPKYYKLRLHPDLKEKTFSGLVTIRVELLEPTMVIPVHAKKLNVTETIIKKLVRTEKVPIPVLTTYQYDPFEYWVTEFDKPLDPGEYSLNFTFNGNLTDRIVGFYQSSYFDKTANKTRWMATSKFEPTYARQAFPCFDEPEMKAKFKITLVRPREKGYIALSNMNQLSEEDIDATSVAVNFAESVPMSTYLACFIVCDFEYKEKIVDTKDKGDPFAIRVFATPAQKNKVDFALDTGVKIVEHYIQYFQIPYPLPKLDMAAIPDFVSGAMEHWGLVTFRETGLLYDETISSSANKQRVGSVIAHELAHMWFGNLVTMKWWNDLWLNEGFASYIQYKGLDVAKPLWKMMDQFLVDSLHGVMKLDGTLASHPIVQTVENPDQITELFDSITYQKGASIIRMLENFVGEDIFQEAVTNYLEKYKYKNAVTDDLLTEIDALMPDSDIKYMMQTWTQQMGLPVVQISIITETEEYVAYKITQKRFFANPEDYKNEYNDSPFNYKWYIPITYQYVLPNGTNMERKSLIFKNSDTESAAYVPKHAKWLKFNIDQVGYYRVNYPEDIWRKIIVQLNSAPANESLYSVADRAHLLNDAFSLADAEQLSYEVALFLTKYLKQETDYVPWSVAASKINSLRHILYYTNAYEQFVKYARSLILSAYDYVGWDVKETNQDSHLKNLLRVTILDAACALEVPDCIAEVTARFEEWINDPTKTPHPDIRDIVYNYGMAHAGNNETWTIVWLRFKWETDASEKLKLMHGLAAIKESWILQKFIDLAWDENNVRSQDYFTCIQSIAANRIGESIVWDYVRGNWDKLVARFGLNERYLGRMIPSITSRFSTEVKLQEMKDFFEKYPKAGAGTAARRQALANVGNNIKWLESNKNKVSEWLEKQEIHMYTD